MKLNTEPILFIYIGQNEITFVEVEFKMCCSVVSRHCIRDKHKPLDY